MKDAGAAQLDVERLALALRTDHVRRYVSEAWVEGGVSEAGYATVDEMADAIAREYAATGDDAKEYDPEYMCPNCVTPWKCNGPHIPE